MAGKLRVIKCKSCKEVFTQHRFMQSICSPKCAIDYQVVLKSNKEKLENKSERAELKVLKQNLMSLTDWKTILQTHINQIVRLIDEGQPCIATGAITGKRNAGHFYSRGSNDTIRFHLDNIHIQSEHSNSFNGGDTLRYIEGLKSVYGNDYFEHVMSLKSIKPIKLTIPQVQIYIASAKAVVKELKEANHIYDSERRKELRNYYNNEIGIY